MGNTQCGVPAIFDEAFQVHVTSQREAVVEEPSAEAAFLQVHVPDRPEKCLLDPREVTKAIIDQAQELMERKRRSLDDDHGANSILDDDVEEMSRLSDDDMSSTTGVEVSSDASLAPSSVARVNSSAAMAPSVVTRGSAATEPVGNNHRSSRLRQSPPRPIITPPRIKGGKDFQTSASLQMDIRKTLMTGNQRSRRKNSMVPLSILPEHGCQPLVASCGAPEPQDPEYTQRVTEFTSVLHLKYVPHCITYYQKQLSRLLPYNAVTQAVTNSITHTNLSPPRPSTTTPDLVRVFSDESSSEEILDFGEGPPSNPVFLLATDTSFMDLAVTGSLGLVVDRQKKTRGAVPERRRRLKSPDHYIVLLNRRSGAPLAVCALKAGSTVQPVVRMFATKRRVYGQRAAATTRKLGLDWSTQDDNAAAVVAADTKKYNLPLYTWCEIVTEGQYPGRVRYSMFMSTGNGQFEETPSLCAVHETAGSTEIRVVGKTEGELYHSGCAVLSMCTNDDDSADEDNVFFRISVSRGIDPALLVCFAAFVDEALEKTMRLQCQRYSESVYTSMTSF